jgi:hypothetical protein
MAGRQPGQVRRWRDRDYLSDDKPVSAEQRREVIREEQEALDQYPNQLAESEAVIEWLKGIDRSNPQLKSVACPPAPEKAGRKTMKPAGPGFEVRWISVAASDARLPPGIVGPVVGHPSAIAARMKGVRGYAAIEVGLLSTTCGREKIEEA